jgi:signal transduction histidine kinase
MQAEEKKLSARAVLSAEEKERKRISRDLHDNIGAYATVLMANTEQLKQQAAGQIISESAEKVSTNAQNIMGSLQQTIWVLNNDIITVTDFIDRFKYYSKKMLQPFSDIQIRFKEQIETNLELSPSEALHIFRIMQEALQNTIKHANPKNILVTADSNKTIIISIKDDGRGFDSSEITYGNGLQNMQQRAKEAGYQFNITSTSSGTEIKVEKNHPYAVL